jgi:uncharacterized protein (DUF736 family)
MAEYDPNMRGVLFKNDKKGNPKRPDYRGTAVIDNVDLNVSGWIKESKKDGSKYMSLSFEAKKPLPLKAAPQQTLTEDNWVDDDINF